MKTLDSLAFPEELDRKTFENLLDTLDNITPKWIDRKEYDDKKGDILVRK
jgi:hypothetical protein